MGRIVERVAYSKEPSKWKINQSASCCLRVELKNQQCRKNAVDHLSIEIATVIKMVPHKPTLRKGRIRCWEKRRFSFFLWNYVVNIRYVPDRWFCKRTHCQKERPPQRPWKKNKNTNALAVLILSLYQIEGIDFHVEKPECVIDPAADDVKCVKEGQGYQQLKGKICGSKLL